MGIKKEGLDRLCQVYEALNDDEKREVVKYAKGLLSSLEKNANDDKKSKKGNRKNDT